MTNPRDLRVSDAEREHVVGVLQKAIGRGLLTLDEFTERTDTALAAKTRGQLNAVLLDLPGVTHDSRAVSEPGSPEVFGERTELTSRMSSVRRKGEWVVPPRLVVRSHMGSTDLDFRDAKIPHAVVDVELDVTAGSVRIVVPEGSTVNAHGIEISAGSLKDRVGFGEGGRPHFVVHGAVRMGSVEIKRKKCSRF
ncbi:DUF1707 domain-containing protein [Saccharothrix violaceirubra]|uniref:DUF1707 domain-containing protein n=1 Tax=Saccharothrix violaceirubra TaxID=413306 RepID=A0A7W7WZH9_9PSEU|nr:DUF1707 domain-containing protein [Saccharothrix violaceirubra]MBB4969332.1 hypothetical protein [Saccharothrix violaceirubra]